jgi:hypothetical protein
MTSAEAVLREELARLDAEILIFEQIEVLSDQARRDLEARRARRDEIVAAIAALRG